MCKGIEKQTCKPYEIPVIEEDEDEARWRLRRIKNFENVVSMYTDIIRMNPTKYCVRRNYPDGQKLIEAQDLCTFKFKG
jgi:hypothetical protein